MKGSRRGPIRGRGNTAVWELRVHAGRHPVTGKPRYISKTVTGNAAAADAQLAELVAEVTGGRHEGPDITFGSLLDRWLAHATTIKGLSPTTVREHRRTIDRNIRPVLGDVLLRDLDGKVLDASTYTLMSREDPSPCRRRRCGGSMPSSRRRPSRA